MSTCRRYVVSGRVQGVFFRAGTQQTAQQLGLSGWVRNLPDGRVELVACGEEAKLKQLEAWLWRGTPQSQVEQVQSNVAPAQAYRGFNVTY